MSSQPVLQHQDMWNEINSLHLSYLQTEECLKKIKEQDRLEELMTKFLSFVAHERKFCHPEISFVLRNSVKGKKDFSASKAISAWSALAKYAQNLLCQPWRKEFYAIQKYGGFFHHNIKSALIDWERIFELIGYKVEKDTMILNEVFDREKLTYIARDCFIAQVECQIMLTIYAKVVKTCSDCTWEDILYYRENYTCSADQAIHGLLNLLDHRNADFRDVYSNNQTPYSYMYDTHHGMKHSKDYLQYPPQPPLCFLPQDMAEYQSFAPDYDLTRKPLLTPNIHHVKQDHMPPKYPCDALPNSESYTKPFKSQLMYGACDVHSSERPVIFENGCCSNCYATNYNGVYAGSYKLHYSNQNKYLNHVYSCPPPPPRSRLVENYENSYQETLLGSSRNNRSSVYGGNVNCNIPVSQLDLENAMKAFSLDEIDKTAVENESSEKSLISPEDELLKSTVTSKVPENIKITKKPKSSEKSSEPNDLSWECKYCTYLNSPKNVICDMCNKSKNLGNENLPLITGGRHCHNCTLVNERDAKTCRLCDFSLEGSSTYI